MSHKSFVCRLIYTQNPLKDFGLDLSFFQPFPTSSTGVTRFCTLVVCKYLHRTHSPVGWIFQRTVIIGSFLSRFHSVSNSAKALVPSLELYPTVELSLPSFSSSSSPFHVHVVLPTGKVVGHSFGLWAGTPIPHLMLCISGGGRLYKLTLTVEHFI